MSGDMSRDLSFLSAYGMVWERDSLQLDCSSGTRFSPPLRPFDSNLDYIKYKDASENA